MEAITDALEVQYNLLLVSTAGLEEELKQVKEQQVALDQRRKFLEATISRNITVSSKLADTILSARAQNTTESQTEENDSAIGEVAMRALNIRDDHEWTAV